MNDKLILDGTKIQWYPERIKAWERGERIVPITIDMALLPRPKCNFNCQYCYGNLQEQEGWDKRVIDRPIIDRFLEDAAEIGVKGISLVSDGESSHSPVFEHTIKYGKELGLDMAVGSNALVVGRHMAGRILPHLTYFRVNISAGEAHRYAEIMGVKEAWFNRVVTNIRDMVAIKKFNKLLVTIGLQMVLLPEYKDQIMPLTNLALAVEVDYLVIKHCSDDPEGTLGVDYEGYDPLYDILRRAEAMSNEVTQISVKWSKIAAKGRRAYQRCYGPPFHIQLSGTGLVAPCGMLFSQKHKKDFWIGNICETSFKEIWQSDRYWEVMDSLHGPDFDPRHMCGSLCLQHCTNQSLFAHSEGEMNLLEGDPGPEPEHLSFI